MDACEELVKRYTPDLTKVRFRKDGNMKPAHAQPMDDGTFDILSPYPDTPMKALYFLHECAHIATGDWRAESYVVHESEYRAEITAIAWWRAEGNSVPVEYLDEAKEYLRECIADDRAAGIPIKRHIERWANSKTARIAASR